MRPGATRRRWIGAALLVALSTPVSSSADPSPPPPAPSCRADDAVDPHAAAGVLLEVVQRSARRKPGAETVQALDNRGANYAPVPDPPAAHPAAPERGD